MSDTTTSTETDTNFKLEADGFASDTFPALSSGAATFVSKDMTSYLRIGAVPNSAEPGDELLDHLQFAGPPGDPKRDDFVLDTTDGQAFDTARTESEANSAGNREVLFIDDVRDHSPQNPGHGMSKHQRQLESAKLKTRGGWREHTDGNRVITTYGDKVEIVRGNYKMVVLGRQDDTGEAMGWDVGCAHIHDYAPGTMPGASVYQEFVEHYPGNSAYDQGVYLLVNSTENVWEYARNAGNFREENWGDRRETYTGSENPVAISTSDTDGTEGHPDDDCDGDSNHTGARPPWANTGTGLVRSNPHIIEKTWATKIESDVGSSACHVPEITDETWTDKLEQKTTVTGDAGGFAFWSEVNVYGNEMALTNTVGPSKIELRHVTGFIVEETACSVYAQLKSALFHFDADIGLIVDIFIGGKVEVDLLKMEVNAGKKELALRKDRVKALKTNVQGASIQAGVGDIRLRGAAKSLGAMSNELKSIDVDLAFQLDL